jgi:peroxisomal enoyl-CoA hydratase 2
MAEFVSTVPAKEGDVGPALVVDEVTRGMFVRYAGASGDFNPIHWDRDYARAAGYPDVFAMGMFAAGLLGTYLTRWFGEGSVRRFHVRFVGQTWAGEGLVCHGEVVRVFREDGVEWAECRIAVDNAQGQAKILGSATCAVLPSHP